MQKKGIELPIFFHNDSTAEFQNLTNKPPKLLDSDIGFVTFFQVTAIGDFEEDGFVYGQVYANGECYTVNMSSTELERKIMEWLG